MQKEKNRGNDTPNKMFLKFLIDMSKVYLCYENVPKESVSESLSYTNQQNKETKIISLEFCVKRCFVQL